MQEVIEENIARIVRELFDIDVEVELTRPEEQFGDFTTNIALQLAGKTQKNPREIAEAVAEKLQSQAHASNVGVAGPGFINIRLSDEVLTAAANDALGFKMDLYLNQIIIADYSDPNPLKPMHAGHLYTTVIGDSITRLIENAGGKVIRINYGGDVGLHVGKSIWGIIKHLGGEFPDKLEEIPATERPLWLGARYKEGNQAYEDDPAAREEIIEANRKVYEIHSIKDHDSAFAKIYWIAREWSYDYFKKIYKQLQVTPFDRFIPESEVSQLGLDTVKEQLSSNVYQESDGAIIFDGEKHGLHTRVFINSQGLPTYEAKDVGLLLTKWQDYHFDKSIVITANEQAQYFEVMLKSVEQFNAEPAQKSIHLAHGVVKFAGGVKFSSRKGNAPLAFDILQSAEEAAKKINENAVFDTVLAAVKYAFLKQRIGGDIIYNPEESVSLEGNSGPYLQYAHARARSILGKAASQPAQKSANAGDYAPGERSLARKITEYPDVVENATKELLPHLICTYLYELAQTFNRFYEKNRVIGDERQAERLQLVGIYADVLKDGLNLLGITAPDKM